MRASIWRSSRCIDSSSQAADVSWDGDVVKMLHNFGQRAPEGNYANFYQSLVNNIAILTLNTTP